MGKYKNIGIQFNRNFRNDLNSNFNNIDIDIQAQKQRVDNLIIGTPQPSEVVDARGEFTLLCDRLNDADAQLAENTYLMSSFQKQTPEVTDIPRIKRAISKLQDAGGGKLKFEKAEYNLPVLNEVDTIQIPSNVSIDFNGATLKVGKGQNGGTYYFTFLINDTKNVSFENANFIWQGSFNSTTDSVTQYGVTRTQYSFNTIIALNGNYDNVTFKNISCIGETDSNTYDALIRSFSSNGGKLKIVDVEASHYSNLLSDGIRNAYINNIRGTKRHNLSNNVYGPSHLIYAGLQNSYVNNIREYGDLLGNSLGTGATIQATGIKNTTISNIHTTMAESGAVVVKGTAIDSTIENIYCSPKSMTSYKNNASLFLVGVNTNLQASIKNLTFKNITCDIVDYNITGVWTGGTDSTWDNIVVLSSESSIQTNPMLAVVTTNTSKITAKIINKSTNEALAHFISGSNGNEISIETQGKFKKNITYYNAAGVAQWGYSKGNVLTEKALTGNVVGYNWRDYHERDSNKYISKSFNDKSKSMKFSNILETTGATVSVTVPLDFPNYQVSAYASSVVIYEFEVLGYGSNSNHIAYKKYSAMLSDGSSYASISTINQITSITHGDPLALSYTIDTTNETITFTCTRAGATYIKGIDVVVRTVMSV
ncbi:hypothetical protein [Fictibacillus nanhaiensis]|uniref:hypothetical protein n=1 Tax=Fictibacillus nanhaiensis TaxID=742169 RepID=UPI003C17CB08